MSQLFFASKAATGFTIRGAAALNAGGSAFLGYLSSGVITIPQLLPQLTPQGQPTGVFEDFSMGISGLTLRISQKGEARIEPDTHMRMTKLPGYGPENGYPNFVWVPELGSDGKPQFDNHWWPNSEATRGALTNCAFQIPEVGALAHHFGALLGQQRAAQPAGQFGIAPGAGHGALQAEIAGLVAGQGIPPGAQPQAAYNMPGVVAAPLGAAPQQYGVAPVQVQVPITAPIAAPIAAPITAPIAAPAGYGQPPVAIAAPAMPLGTPVDQPIGMPAPNVAVAPVAGTLPVGAIAQPAPIAPPGPVAVVSPAAQAVALLAPPVVLPPGATQAAAQV